MATYVPAKRGVEYIFYVSLVQQADTKLLQANPTLASGDVTISKDGGAFANLTTMPTVTPASGKAVKVTVSNTEMTADNVLILFSDAAGAQWCDLSVNIQTAARQIDDLAYPATSGRSMVVDAAGLVDANTVKIGPTGTGTAQTARDVGGNVDVATSTRMATYTQPTGFLAATFPTTVASTTNITAGTITTVTNLTNAPTAGDLTATMKASVNAEVDTALADINLDHWVGTATGIPAVPAGTYLDQIMDDGTAVYDRTTDSLQAIRDNTGTAGAGLTAIDLPDQTMNITGNITGNLSGSVGSVTGAVGSVTGLTTTSIADQVWDEVLSGHLTAGSTGAALNAAGGSGDPWSTAIPGAYGVGTAGYILGNNVDAAVSTRLPTASYTAPDNATIATIQSDTNDIQSKIGTPVATLATDIATVDTVVDAIKVKTDSLTFTVANKVDANTKSINNVTIVGDGSGTPFNV